MNKYEEILKGWKVPSTKTEDEAWVALQQRIASIKPVTKVIQFNYRRWVSVAAAATVLAFGTFYFWPKNESTVLIANTIEQIKNHTLPDGSVVSLNAGSSVSYNPKWVTREISLNGEAYFDVAEGSKFEVHSVHGVVEVTGTEFNVFDRNGNFRVCCFEGSVKLESDGKTVKLAQGEMGSVENTEFVKSDFDTNRKTWREGEFFFTDEPLEVVLEELERQFNITVEAPNFAGKMYNGNFRNNNLEEALDLVCLPMALAYEIKNDMVVVLTEIHD